MIKVSTFQIQINCPGCNSYHSVSSINEYDTCRNCGRTINVSEVLFEKMLGIADRIQYMNGFLSGNVEQMGGSGAYKLVYSSLPAYCEQCNTNLENDLLTDSINNEMPLECPACRHRMPVRCADSMLKRFHPNAVGVINDSSGIDHMEKDINKDSTIVFSCMSCSGALELKNQTKRTIKCSYCSNENYLPDQIWTKLHPNKDVLPLFFVTTVNDEETKSSVDYFLNVTSLLIYSKHFENFIRDYFQKPYISDSVLSWFKNLLSSPGNTKVSYNMDIKKIQKYFFDNFLLGIETHPAELREVVAEHSLGLSQIIQQKLSEDKMESVRLALAKNPQLEKEIIKKLKNDPSSTVASEAKNKKGGFLKGLFG